MAALAKGLPIALIPEQVFIPPVRKDMVHNSRRSSPAISLAYQAQGMPSQISFPGSSPSGVIAADGSILPRIQHSVCLTIHMIRKLGASRLSAGAFWFARHIFSFYGVISWCLHRNRLFLRMYLHCLIDINGLRIRLHSKG